MSERMLEPVPDPTESDVAIVGFMLRMDLADNPNLLNEHLNSMKEVNHDRYRQHIAVANRLSGGDMDKKEAVLQGIAYDDLMMKRVQAYSLDKELADAFEQPVEIAQPEKRKWFRRRVGAAPAIGATVLTSILFLRRERFNDSNDAA